MLPDTDLAYDIAVFQITACFRLASPKSDDKCEFIVCAARLVGPVAISSTCKLKGHSTCTIVEAAGQKIFHLVRTNLCCSSEGDRVFTVFWFPLAMYCSRCLIVLNCNTHSRILLKQYLSILIYSPSLIKRTDLRGVVPDIFLDGKRTKCGKHVVRYIKEYSTVRASSCKDNWTSDADAFVQTEVWNTAAAFVI